MSKISAAYDELLTIIKTDIFAGSKFQLDDAININNNTENALASGFGIRFGPATNSERNISCKMSILRDMIIVLTSRTNAASQFRTDEKYDASKALLEDHFTLIKHFEQEPELPISKVFKFNYSSDPGIQNVFVEKINQSFIKIEILFKMEYLEDVTT